MSFLKQISRFSRQADGTPNVPTHPTRQPPTTLVKKEITSTLYVLGLTADASPRIKADMVRDLKKILTSRPRITFSRAGASILGLKLKLSPFALGFLHFLVIENAGEINLLAPLPNSTECVDKGHVIRANAEIGKQIEIALKENGVKPRENFRLVIFKENKLKEKKWVVSESSIKYLETIIRKLDGNDKNAVNAASTSADGYRALKSSIESGKENSASNPSESIPAMHSEPTLDSSEQRSPVVSSFGEVGEITRRKRRGVWVESSNGDMIYKRIQDCAWPQGGGCMEDSEPGRPYCTDHSKIAFKRPNLKAA